MSILRTMERAQRMFGELAAPAAGTACAAAAALAASLIDLARRRGDPRVAEARADR